MWIAGRKDDIIKRGGEKVSIIHVQEALQGLGRFADVAVVAAPDEILGHVPVAFVVPNEPDGFKSEQAAARAARRVAVHVPAQPRDRRRADSAYRIRKGDSGPSCERCSPRSSGEPRGAGVSSFRRGLRNRNPLVLVVALALLVPALLGIQKPGSPAAAGRPSAAERWERNSTDDYMYVSWMTSHLKKNPPSKPLAVLLGGSSGREALVSGPSLARQVQRNGGPDIVAYNLSSRMQRYAQSWAIVDNLPDTPTTVLVGVNLGRFTTSPQSNYNQVIGRELLLKSDSLRRWVVDHSGEHKYSYTILPGIFSALASYLQQKENAWLKGKQAKPYKVHAFDSRHVAARRREAATGAEVAHQVLPGLQEGPQVRRGDARGSHRRGAGARPGHGHRRTAVEP